MTRGWLGAAVALGWACGSSRADSGFPQVEYVSADLYGPPSAPTPAHFARAAHERACEVCRDTPGFSCASWSVELPACPYDAVSAQLCLADAWRCVDSRPVLPEVCDQVFRCL